jgi:hypothetical protein
MKEGTVKAGSKRGYEEIKKLVEADLKEYKKKKSFANIASLLNDADVSTQVQTIKVITDVYTLYADEIDKITDIMSRSFVRNQKLVSVSIITELSLIYPDYAFPKLAKILSVQGDLIEAVSDALKNLWKNKEPELIKNIQTYWDLKTNKNLKLAAILSIDPSNIDDSEALLDFLSGFIDESSMDVRYEVAMKLKELYIKEPYITESEMRKWLKGSMSKNASQTIILAFKEISKRKDSFLLDRTCLILENWERNEAEIISSTGTKILSLLREKL